MLNAVYVDVVIRTSCLTIVCQEFEEYYISIGEEKEALSD